MEQDAAILAANQRFYDAFNQKDASLMDEVWAAPDAVTCVHPGWNLLSGREAVMGSWGSILANPAQPRIVMGGATVSLRGDVAVVVCRELVGGSPLVATNVFVLEAGAWKLLHHHSGPVYTSG
jgi:ketosteroid isomerase-like protein